MTPQYITCCRQFSFAAAHFLPGYPGKCQNLHGHTWKLEVCLHGRVLANGMVIDFSVLKDIVQTYVIAELDHADLNDILDNPTAENLITWIWDKLHRSVNLYRLRLWESDNSYVEFKGL